MSAGRMHVDEVETDAGLVRRLLVAQFPQWAELSIEPVRSAGTDNAIYRLGTELVVRLPRIHWATGQVEKEQRWLPRLAAHLPLAIPAPLEVGAAGEGYPWHWSIHRWLEGEDAATEPISDLPQAGLVQHDDRLLSADARVLLQKPCEPVIRFDVLEQDFNRHPRTGEYGRSALDVLGAGDLRLLHHWPS